RELAVRRGDRGVLLLGRPRHRRGHAPRAYRRGSRTRPGVRCRGGLVNGTAPAPGVRGAAPIEIQRLAAPPDAARATALVRLAADLQRELGAAYSHEPWGAAHFARDLAGKWALSHLALAGADRLAGFWIASRRGDDAHTHRVAVAREARRLGVGAALFR